MWRHKVKDDSQFLTGEMQGYSCYLPPQWGGLKEEQANELSHEAQVWIWKVELAKTSALKTFAADVESKLGK